MLEIKVEGVPKPQGSMRAISVNGRARIFHDSGAELKRWRRLISDAAGEALNGAPPYDEPVSVMMTFRLPKPARKREHHPAVKPDLDKLIRAVLDGLESSGVIANDSRVCDIRASKHYAEDDHPPGVHLVLISHREGRMDVEETVN